MYKRQVIECSRDSVYGDHIIVSSSGFPVLLATTLAFVCICVDCHFEFCHNLPRFLPLEGTKKEQAATYSFSFDYNFLFTL